jgi:Dolichyl-phosphate-mannose-protein mannosyltransferase
MTGARLNRISIVLSVCFLVIAGFAQSSLMKVSLWEDESWVSNSVLAPSFSKMFHYEKWLQTSPPLFLVLLHASTAVFGKGEVALRLVPWLAGAISAVLVGVTLERLFPAGLAVLGTFFFLTNYWAVKYSQQVKQYTADLLVSSLFFFLLLSFLGSGQKRRTFWALVFAGGIGIFLSYTTVFWLPVAMLAIATFPRSLKRSSSEGEPCADSLRSRFLRSLIALSAYLGCLGLADFFFIRFNRSPSLVDFWKNDFIGSGGLLSSGVRFLVNCSDLMAPQRFSWSRPLSFALGLVVLAALVRAGIASRSGDSKARNLLFVTMLPVLVALTMSAFRQYPVLTYPRMIIWLLPLCTLLLVYAVEPIWNYLSSKTGMPAASALAAGLTFLLCGFAVYFNWAVVGRTNGQNARAAVLYLKNQTGPQDELFVRGITAEQFSYYSELLRWRPSSTYVGNTNLPCCLRGGKVVPQGLGDLGFAQDIHSFAGLTAGKGAWFLMGRGDYQKMWETIRREMASAGCSSVEKRDFENLSLARFDCTSSPFRSAAIRVDPP